MAVSVEGLLWITVIFIRINPNGFLNEFFGMDASKVIFFVDKLETVGL
jgi:hypothetical protein